MYKNFSYKYEKRYMYKKKEIVEKNPLDYSSNTFL